jgi:hypothetical protein
MTTQKTVTQIDVQAWFDRVTTGGQQPVLADFGDERPQISFRGRGFDEQTDTTLWRFARQYRDAVEAFLRERGQWAFGQSLAA